MHFVIDNMLPLSLARFLKTQGFEAIHARGLGLKGTSDLTIWQEAERIGAIVISMDSDFPPLAASSLRAKLLHYKGGNTTVKTLLEKFEQHLPAIVRSFEDGDKIVELS